MLISLIAAMANNRIIGQDNRLPWHLPADFAWFKNNTLGKPVIMGRKTYHSIGKPLVNRMNIVLSHQPIIENNLYWARSIEQALTLAEHAEEIMIIGGASIYQAFLPLADRLYLTKIKATIAGDSYFPNYQHFNWHTELQQIHPADSNNRYTMCFEILTRSR